MEASTNSYNSFIPHACKSNIMHMVQKSEKLAQYLDPFGPQLQQTLGPVGLRQEQHFPR